MIVLDTHAWLWWAADRSKLRPRLRARLGAERDLVVSAISCWEIAMLVERGRLKLDRDPRLAIRDLLAIPRLRVVQVSDTIAVEAALLGSQIHGDPADRIIVATALELHARLATRDEGIRRTKIVETLW